MATQIRFYTVNEAAKELGVSGARVRQVLTNPAAQEESNIGMKHGWAWVLTAEDIEKLKKYISVG